MFSPFTALGPFWLRTYTLLVALTVFTSAGLGLYRLRKCVSLGAAADVYLGALIGGVLLARLEHVLLNWSYFADNLHETVRLNAGGLEWHGALMGGLIGLALVARWRRVSSREILDSLTLALPLLAMGGWSACWASACGYGKEVDTLAHYPAFAVSEAPDVYGIIAPRYSTQLFGLLLAGVLLLLAGLLIWRGWLRNVRFWLLLALLSAGMFSIGLVRGESVPLLAGLRADQWLDAAVGVVSVIIGITALKRRSSS